ncbi:hypothetical protein HDU98_003441 [Podochytrium sp. JEL0797]|nr:hypothetical protein HDU98_003441 [Podochytrium sp. JEL0797]
MTPLRPSTTPNLIDHYHPAIARAQINRLPEEEKATFKRAPPTLPRQIDYYHPAIARAQINGFHDPKEPTEEPAMIIPGALSPAAAVSAPPVVIHANENLYYPALARAIINRGTPQQIASLRSDENGSHSAPHYMFAKGTGEGRIDWDWRSGGAGEGPI